MMKICVDMDSDGIGDAVLCTPVVSGLMAAHQNIEVVYKVRPRILPWLSMFADCQVTSEPQDCPTLKPYDSYAKELRDRSDEPRINLYARECGLDPRLLQKPTWVVPHADLDWASQYAGSVILFPYSAWGSRNYPIKYWQAIEALFLKYKRRVLILDAPGDGKRTEMFKGIRMWGQPAARVAALMSVSAGVMCGDSGPAHLAGALGVPCLALCGAIPGEKLFAYWDSVDWLNGKLPCNGCHFGGPDFVSSCNTRCESLATILPVDAFYRLDGMRAKMPRPKTSGIAGEGADKVEAEEAGKSEGCGTCNGPRQRKTR